VTQGSSNEECSAVIKDLTEKYGKETWFLTAYTDRDDHGPCVVVKVDAKNPSRIRVDHPNKNVKICTYLMQR
jgi:hypothetical protein